MKHYLKVLIPIVGLMALSTAVWLGMGAPVIAQAVCSTGSNYLAISNASGSTINTGIPCAILPYTGAQFQTAGNKWATRGTLVAGATTFAYPTTLTATPICVAVTEGTSAVHVTPAVGSCVVTAATLNDTSVVDIVVIANPN
jgi:hypothetical protein